MRKDATTCQRPIVRVLLAAVACALLATTPASAYVLGQFDWDGASVQGWDRDHDTWPDLSVQPGGVSGGYLQIQFPSLAEGAPGEDWYDLVSAPSAYLFAGDWNQNMTIEFDFFAEDTAPAGLAVRWGVEDGRTWSADLDTDGIVAGEWTSFDASLANWEDWILEPFVTEGDFLADLENIDWIGVYIFRDGTDEQTYGLDNFRLTIPEPHEYAMLALTLVVMGVAFRRRTAQTVKVSRGN